MWRAPPVITTVLPSSSRTSEFYLARVKALRLGMSAEVNCCAMTSATREVVLYSRKGCHLCELVKESLQKLERRGGFQWREIDVDSAEDLRRQFNDEVPVVFIDGKKAFKYRMDEKDFLRRISS